MAGGKACALALMWQSGIQVPEGFVVLTNAFDRFLGYNRLNQRLKNTLNNLKENDTQGIRKAAQKIQAYIEQADIPPEIGRSIRREMDGLAAEAVAVRSSATAEDSAAAAWAGQLKSYLNVDNSEVVRSIKECWGSLFSEQALHYRLALKSSPHLSLAVVVQKMIPANASGIAFSLDPVSQSDEAVVIEAGPGLGEAVVGGWITPDKYTVAKQEPRLLNQKINKQTKALYPLAGGSTEWRHIPEAVGANSILNKIEIIDLAASIVSIEQLFGYPVDVEWARDQDGFHITQARPVTALRPGQDKISEYRKIMTRPLSLLDCECWDICERLRLPEHFGRLLYFTPLFIRTPGKAVAVYYDFSDPGQDPGVLVAYLAKNIAWFRHKKEEFDIDCREVRDILNHRIHDRLRLRRLIESVWPAITVANIIGSSTDYEVPDELRRLCVSIRQESDDVLHPALDFWNELVKSGPEPRSASRAKAELVADNGQLQERVEDGQGNDWLFHKGVLYSDVKQYLRANGIELVDNAVAGGAGPELRGETACKGRAIGQVRLVFELRDMDKVQNSDVLVTPMTVPEMMPALKKTAAVVTDEGGVTCHAAIVSRELQVPCITGTGNATAILTDKDRVEVNADKGFVRIFAE